MVLVAAGEFLMGEDGDVIFQDCKQESERCSRDHFMDQEPVHKVWVDDFYIDIYEVTNAQYKECVNSNVCTKPDRQLESNPSYYDNTKFDDYPVVFISWHMASQYCEWRNARLPTEAEWEKAARGNEEGKVYPWGDDPPACAIGAYDGATFYDCNPETENPTHVGSYGPNGYGLFDMIGNVSEWVMDWYSATYYDDSPYSNPLGPSSGNHRIHRGGSWQHYLYATRNSMRTDRSPGDAFSYNGFRCARSVESEINLGSNKICVQRIDEGDTLFSILQDKYDDSQATYHYYEICSYRDDKIICSNPHMLTPDVFDSIAPGWWLQIPDIYSTEQCYVYGLIAEVAQ
jgi:formylglycine-generating enzyme required for sulfatase activity